MALYDQTQVGGTPWYGAQQYNQPTRSYNTSTPINQFVWVNGPGMVDMYPVAAGSEMTFIDNENMILYVKRVDEYNHPLKVRKFRMTELLDEATVKDEKPTFNMDELKAFIQSEVDKTVNTRIGSMFSFNSQKGDVSDD